LLLWLRLIPFNLCRPSHRVELSCSALESSSTCQLNYTAFCQCKTAADVERLLAPNARHVIPLSSLDAAPNPVQLVASPVYYALAGHATESSPPAIVAAENLPRRGDVSSRVRITLTRRADDRSDSRRRSAAITATPSPRAWRRNRYKQAPPAALLVFRQALVLSTRLLARHPGFTFFSAAAVAGFRKAAASRPNLSTAGDSVRVFSRRRSGQPITGEMARFNPSSAAPQRLLRITGGYSHATRRRRQMSGTPPPCHGRRSSRFGPGAPRLFSARHVPRRIARRLESAVASL